MMYYAYQAYSDLMEPVRAAARLTQGMLQNSPGPLGDMMAFRHLAAGCEMLTRATLTHHRPPYGIDRVKLGKREVGIIEEATLVTPFGTLLRFKKDVEVTQPRVLVVAPLSGHYATLLRGTVETLLPEHDVYITDWHNARDVSIAHGRFGFDEYVDHVIRFLETLGPGAHVVAVCQPCVQVLTAVALMAENGNKAQPRSMTLMAGPIDCRVNPTEVNNLATGKPIEWFEKNLLDVVPQRFAGAGRKVYPGFVQLTAFMSMNMERHIKAHMELYENLAAGESEKAEATKTFYDEYFAVLDLPAEFYIETVQRVFQEYHLAEGRLVVHGQKVNPRAIRRTALLTVEGEKDDICSVGQTLAAHDLCTGLKPYLRKHHLQPGVGHYGVFNGRRWNSQIYPLVRNLILAHD
ncbi:MAG: polyhydroxyalkanoate depolymerase [Ferrovibrio sp.]|nr:polyhydroxyalkanoate depolymerase [Ferrovibrio sp.]MBP7064799.1 polyhydroxyalkanoate depolymerase [Ferrovibrio sp.]